MYIWDKQVKSIEWELVTFKDWTTREVYKKLLDKIQTKKMTDASTLRNLATDPLASDILWLLLLYDVKAWDIDFILGTVKQSLIVNEEAAISKLFNVEFKSDIRMSALNKVLMDNVNDKK